MTTSTGDPAALTTASAPTTSPSTAGTGRAALPTPPSSRPPATSAPVPAPVTPRSGVRGLAPDRRATQCGVGPGGRAGGPAPAEVEDRRGGHDRHHSRRADLEAAALFLQPRLHAARRRQPVGAAAGEDDGIHGGDQRGRVQGVGLVRPGPPPRTSTAPTLPAGGRTTVTPVSRPSPVTVAEPTRTPGTSVIAPQRPGVTASRCA